MIQPVHLLLARAKRARTALLFCQVSCLEQIEACMEAFRMTGKPGVLTLGASTDSEAASLEGLLAYAHYVGEHAREPIGVEVRLNAFTQAQRQIVTRWNRYGAFAVSLPAGHSSEGLPTERIAILPPGNFEVPDSCQAVRLPGHGSLSHAAEAAKAIKLPVILGERQLTASQLKSLRGTIVGVTLDEQLDASFTAGVRAGLRDREVRAPERYLARGRAAARERIANYLAQL